MSASTRSGHGSAEFLQHDLLDAQLIQHRLNGRCGERCATLVQIAELEMLQIREEVDRAASGLKAQAFAGCIPGIN